MIDDQRLSDLEIEATDAAWESWARRDVHRKLEGASGMDTWTDCLDSVTEPEWYWLLMAAEEDGNPLSEPEGTSVHFRVDDIVARIVALLDGSATLRWTEENAVLDRLRLAFRGKAWS